MKQIKNPFTNPIADNWVIFKSENGDFYIP
jgi:hypothetical protein